MTRTHAWAVVPEWAIKRIGDKGILFVCDAKIYMHRTAAVMASRKGERVVSVVIVRPVIEADE